MDLDNIKFYILFKSSPIYIKVIKHNLEFLIMIKRNKRLLMFGLESMQQRGKKCIRQIYLLAIAEIQVIIIALK